MTWNNKPVIISSFLGAIIGSAVVWVGTIKPPVALERPLVEAVPPNSRTPASPRVPSNAAGLEQKISELGAEIQQLKLMIEQSVNYQARDTERKSTDDSIIMPSINAERVRPDESSYSGIGLAVRWSRSF